MIVYWFSWGIFFTILFVADHSINDYLSFINSFLKFIKPFTNTLSHFYIISDFFVKLVTKLMLAYLCYKSNKNALRNVMMNFTKLNINNIIYIILGIAFSIILIFIFSRINKNVLKRLELVAIAGLITIILMETSMKLKEIFERVRFREMVAWSNDLTKVDDNVTLSNGSLRGWNSPLSKVMEYRTDFSAFTPFYKHGSDKGIYSHCDSFPSGHTIYSSMALIYPALISCFKKSHTVVFASLSVAFIYVCSMGVSRIIAGAHYLTDVCVGDIIGYAIILIAFFLVKYVNAFYTKKCSTSHKTDRMVNIEL